MTAPVSPLPPCPHPGDPSHGGLGKGWCDAGREGQHYLAQQGRCGACKHPVEQHDGGGCLWPQWPNTPGVPTCDCAASPSSE